MASLIGDEIELVNFTDETNANGVNVEEETDDICTGI